ncbi:MAG: hypothetical protein GX352_09880 [Clostridiales bacterium]|nr:hypothetical protein [Clostridiales bacterium]
MLIKIFSSLVIILCCAFLGIHMSYKYNRRLYNFRMLNSMLIRLEAEIVQYSTLLSQALRSSANQYDGEWKPIFLNIADALESGEEHSLEAIWQKHIRILYNNPYIGQSEYETMYRFGVQLGSSDKKTQGRFFELARAQLKAEEANAEELRLKYSKMYRSLGILLGFGIAIILF